MGMVSLKMKNRSIEFTLLHSAPIRMSRHSELAGSKNSKPSISDIIRLSR